MQIVLNDFRTMKVRSASRRHRERPANRCTNAVRSIWPSSAWCRCRNPAATTATTTAATATANC